MEERPWTKSECFAWSDGRRIVDLYELSKQLHCKQCSSLLDLRCTEREARYGLASVLYILCNCGVMNDVHTGRMQQDAGNRSSPNPMYEINIKASINLLMYGAGASHVLSFLALLDVPVPPPDDTSLIVPVTENADVQGVPQAPPSTTTTTTTTTAIPQPSTVTVQSDSSSSFHKTQPSSSSTTTTTTTTTTATTFVQESGFHSVPLPPNDVDDNIAMPLADNDDYDDDENDIDFDNEDDEEYVPVSKSKPKSKPKARTSKSTAKAKRKPSPASKKPALRGPKSARIKRAAKLAAQNAVPVKIKLKLKNERTELPPDSSENSAKEEEVDSQQQMYVNPAEWSSNSDTETESLRGKKSKDSDDSWHEEEEDFKEEGEEEAGNPPKRKRGRPRGSTDKAKRVRRLGSRSKSDPSSPPRKPGRPKLDRSEEDIPKCTVCDKDFSSRKGYNVHMKRVHNQEVKGSGPVKAASLSSSIWHTLDSDSGAPVCLGQALDVPVYICTVCKQPFARHYTIVGHIEKKHWTPTLEVKEYYHTRPVSDVLEKVRRESSVQDGKARERYRLTHRCMECHKTGMGQDTATRHLCVNEQGRLTCTTVCPQGLRLSHMQRCLLFSNRLGYLCDHCGDVFSNKASFDMHLLNSHGQVTKRSEKYKCSVCGHSFGDGSALKCHRKTHVTDQPKAHICDMCGKAFKSRDTLYGHRRRVHQLSKRYQCQYCSKTYYIKALWKTHTQQHLGESPYHCAQCNQGFSSNYCLTVHMRIHTGEKPYKCQQCEAAFAQKNSLDVHMKKHKGPLDRLDTHRRHSRPGPQAGGKDRLTGQVGVNQESEGQEKGLSNDITLKGEPHQIEYHRTAPPPPLAASRETSGQLGQQFAEPLSQGNPEGAGRQSSAGFGAGLSVNSGFPGFANYSYTEPSYMLPLPPHFQPR